MKYLSIFLIFFIIAFCGYSQSSFSIGPQIGFGSNLGNSKLGIGGSLDYTNKFSENVGIRASAGYTHFQHKIVNESHISFIPVRAGLQGFIGNVFFVYGEAGIGFYKTGFSDGSKFSYAFGMGYNAHFGLNKQYVEVSAFYNSIPLGANTLYRWFNLRLAYGFNLGKKN
jgi:hypothetical protein